MHEMSIAEAVVEQITQRLGDARISLVRLDIGELSGVVPDAIRFCFDLAADGTSVAGAAVEIAVVSARCRCGSCGVEFRPVDAIRLCPCGSVDVVVIAGEELRIASVGVNEHV